MRSVAFWHKTTINLVVVLFILVSGFLIGNFYVDWQDQKNHGTTNNQIRIATKGDYVLTNPLLECGDINSLSNRDVAILKTAVRQVVDTSISNGWLDHISVYFRDLNNGPWFGINEKEEFIPGSLTKVPLMMSLFKEAEINPGLLKEIFFYEGGSVGVEPYFKPKQEITPGKAYAVPELIAV